MNCTSLARRLTNLLKIAVLLTGVATVAGWLGGVWWMLDLAAHFRVQYALALALAAIVALALRRWKLAVAALCLAALNAAILLPYWPPRVEKTPPPANAIRIVSFNVHTANPHFNQVLAHLESRDPDAIFLMEVNAAWIAKLQPLIRRYPHSLLLPREDNFGIAFLSRLPIDSLVEVEIGQVGVPSALMKMPGLAIIGTHPLPPASGSYAQLRDGQLDALADTARGIGGPLIVVGDLNATPWSAPFRHVIRQGRLRDSALGRGLHPTWKGAGALFVIPIDHALVSPDIRVHDRAVGPDLGSDHRPLEVTISLGG